MSVVIAVVLLLALTAYAVLGGADFGAGLWDLAAGGPGIAVSPVAGGITRYLRPGVAKLSGCPPG